MVCVPLHRNSLLNIFAAVMCSIYLYMCVCVCVRVMRVFIPTGRINEILNIMESGLLQEVDGSFDVCLGITDRIIYTWTNTSSAK